MFKLYILIILLWMMMIRICVGQFNGTCQIYNSSIAAAKLIVDFATWRELNEIEIIKFDNDGEFSDCADLENIEKIILTELNTKGIAASFLSSSSFNISVHRIGIVITIHSVQNIPEIIKMINFNRSFVESYEWLFILDYDLEFNFYHELCKLKLRMDTNILVAIQFPQLINKRIAKMKNILLELQGLLKLANTDSPWAVDVISVSERVLQDIYSGHEDEVVGMYLKYKYFPQLSSEANNYQIVQVYKIRTEIDRSCLVSQLGSHSFKGFLSRKMLAVEDRTNMYQFPIHVAQLNFSTKDHHDEDYSDEVYALELFTSYFLELLNASLIKREFDEYGDKEGNGTWTGLFNSVITGESDIGIGSIYVTFDRAAAMKFTVPILNTYRSVYLRQPEASSIRDIYMSPFTPLLLGMVILMCVSLAFLLKLSYILTEDERLSWSDLGIWCGGILFMQGSTVTPKSTASLGIVVVALLFGLIVFNAYSASITSTLSIQFQEINSLNDLFGTDFSIGFVRDSNEEVYLNETDDKDLQILYKKGLRDKKPVSSNVDGLYKALKSRYAHFGSQTVLRRSILTLGKRDQCLISEVKILSTNVKITFPLTLDSPYRKIITLSLMKMLERGILDEVDKYILPELPHCDDANIFSSAKLSDVFTAFGVLLGTIGISSFMVLVEIIWKRQSSRFVKLITNKKQ